MRGSHLIQLPHWTQEGEAVQLHRGQAESVHWGLPCPKPGLFPGSLPPLCRLRASILAHWQA